MLSVSAASGAISKKAKLAVGPIGDIKYTDGTVVLSGESYAIIFTKAGETFAGFNADGTLKDSAKSVFAFAGTLNYESNGIIKGTEVAISQTSANYTALCLTPLDCSDGYFELYVVDSRVIGEGGVTNLADRAVAREDQTFKFPTSINAWVKVAGTSAVRYPTTSDFTTGISNYATIVNENKEITIINNIVQEFPAIEATPQPVITGVVYGGAAGGGTPALPKVTIGVTNTVATAMYRLVKSANVNFTPATTNAAVSGASAKTATLEFVDEYATEAAAFYKIVVDE